MMGVRVHVSRVIRGGGALGDHTLNSAERAQAERLIRESDRPLFRNGRVQRRRILGRYLNADPADCSACWPSKFQFYAVVDM
jgi:hypothetical protein